MWFHSNILTNQILDMIENTQSLLWIINFCVHSIYVSEKNTKTIDMIDERKKPSRDIFIEIKKTSKNLFEFYVLYYNALKARIHWFRMVCGHKTTFNTSGVLFFMIVSMNSFYFSLSIYMLSAVDFVHSFVWFFLVFRNVKAFTSFADLNRFDKKKWMLLLLFSSWHQFLLIIPLVVWIMWM